ncbi:unnamed protein product [Orchesella dallaii]|uniref:Uncharacterized protein n=1 Tax=Orchesella dallaii TaxID=48710 RepID=A0ABP1RLZ9_9HEXA
MVFTDCLLFSIYQYIGRLRQCIVCLSTVTTAISTLLNIHAIFKMSDNHSCNNINNCRECLQRFCSFVRLRGSNVYQCVDDSFSGYISRYISPGDLEACEDTQSTPLIVATQVEGESIWIKIAAVSLVVIAFILGLMGAYWVHQCQRKRKLDHEFKFTLERFQQEDGDGIPIYNIQHFNQLHENLPPRRPDDADNVEAEQVNAEEAAADEGYGDDDDDSSDDDDDDDDDEEYIPPPNNQPPPPPPPSPPAKRRRIQTDFFQATFRNKSHM